MKKIFILFAALLVLPLYSQSIIYNFEIAWSEPFSGVTGSLNCVAANLVFDSNAVVWACGNYGIVLRSTNDGLTWVNVGPNGIPGNINLTSISLLGWNIAVTAGYFNGVAYVYRTENGGLNWTQVLTQENGSINGIYLNYYGKSFMQGNPVGGRWSLWKSTDLGMTWDSSLTYLAQNNNENGWNNSYYVQDEYNGGRIWFGTNNSRIYYTSNSGINWTVQNTPEQNIYSLNWFGISEIAGGNNLFTSSNYGSVWNPVSSIGSGIINAMTIPQIMMIIPYDFLPSTPWMYLRNDDKIYYTDDGAFNWEVKYTAPSGTYRHITSTPTGIWAVRSNGGITRGSIDAITSVPPNNYPYSFELKQNYPNPFNPKTKIPVVVYKSTFMRLNVYSATGKLISTLIDNYYPLQVYDLIEYPNTYFIEWDGTDYPSGVYFYQLTAGDYQVTKKMTLLK